MSTLALQANKQELGVEYNGSTEWLIDRPGIRRGDQEEKAGNRVGPTSRNSACQLTERVAQRQPGGVKRWASSPAEHKALKCVSLFPPLLGAPRKTKANSIGNFTADYFKYFSCLSAVFAVLASVKRTSIDPSEITGTLPCLTDLHCVSFGANGSPQPGVNTR